MNAPLEARRELDVVRILEWMWAARASDLAEQHLIRQGKGWIHIPSQGHESLAALGGLMRPGDLLFPYYRDRALLFARGVTAQQVADDFVANARSSTCGKQMPFHGTFREHGIFPPVTPTGSQCLPAAGAAWGVRKTGDDRVVVCTIGDAATRQGEFYEACCFALQERLPIVFVVEDNGYGISTPTARHLPFRLGMFADATYVACDGRRVDEVVEAGRAAIARARSGEGPSILLVELDRMTSHTNSDDHRIYRADDDIRRMQERDPVTYAERLAVSLGALSEEDLPRMRASCTRSVDSAYDACLAVEAPHRRVAASHLYGDAPPAPPVPPHLRSARTMVAAWNATLAEALERVSGTIVFGEDVEDPKGGVFGFTKGLSTRFPDRVVNAPLAEATIVGVGVGLAALGFRPVVELQFIDFAAPAFNQLVTQAATLRWRSNAQWTCPLVIMAPYGAYLPAGGTWHSQSNEGTFAHIPGLRVVVPSAPDDVAELLWTALHQDDPTLLLLPKHLMRARAESARAALGGIGSARTLRAGTDVTVVTWGNCVELAMEAAQQCAGRWSVEVIDLVSLVPCDWPAIEGSVAKTGRLVVVTEDTRTCSFGQAVVCEMVSSAARFNLLFSPPVLVAREDGHIPFHPDLEYALLPDLARVTGAIEEVMR